MTFRGFRVSFLEVSGQFQNRLKEFHGVLRGFIWVHSLQGALHGNCGGISEPFQCVSERFRALHGSFSGVLWGITSFSEDLQKGFKGFLRRIKTFQNVSRCLGVFYKISELKHFSCSKCKLLFLLKKKFHFVA